MYRIPTTVAFALACAALSGSAAADTQYTFSGQMCFVENPDDVPDLRKSQTGFHNGSSVDDTYFWSYCPVVGWETSTVEIQEQVVRYGDSDPNHALKCQFQGRDQDGNGNSTSFRHSCNPATYDADGCTTNDNPFYTGAHHLRWHDGEVTFGGSAEPEVAVMTAKCQVYGKEAFDPQGTEGHVYVFGYRSTFVNP